ncbi:MAG TPA: BMP family ABC transporter substrate-binding protein [Chloroflexia bacterium]|nr:BMP family ABC transporter substrate-binding protein [Chloroflexia bacterium]
MSTKRRIFGRAGASLAAMLMVIPILAACGGTAANTPVPNTAVPATAAPTAMAATAEPTAMPATAEPTAMATTAATAMATTGTMADMTVTMKEQNASGQNGTATVKQSSTGWVVTIDISGGTTEPQPAHIHKGTCANLDPAPAVALTAVVNGKSETTISTSDFTMAPGQAYAINVHKSAAEASVYVSCGDITDSSMMGNETPGAVMTPGAGGSLKVGLVTDVGKVNDGTFNQFAYDGLKRADTELGVETNFIETTASADYDKNLEQFASQNYDMIIAVGFLMGDALKAAAAKHPTIKYAIVDYAYSPDIPNVRGLVFAEDQSGYLAGVLAASMSKSNIIGVVGGIETVPAVKKFVVGYANGAKSIKPDIEVKQVYIASFTDRARGAEAATSFIAEGADVIFGAGGQTGSGAIQAAAQAGVWVIGVDQDEYVTTFQRGAAPGSDKILSSAGKRVDNAVFSAIKSAQDGSFAGGTQLYDAASQGVGLAPFHDADASIPAEVKTKLDETLKGLADGSIKTGVTVP